MFSREQPKCLLDLVSDLTGAPHSFAEIRGIQFAAANRLDKANHAVSLQRFGSVQPFEKHRFDGQRQPHTEL